MTFADPRVEAKGSIACSPALTRRQAATRCAPWCTSCFTVPKPEPESAPVTMYTRPLRSLSNSVGSHRSVLGIWGLLRMGLPATATPYPGLVSVGGSINFDIDAKRDLGRGAVSDLFPLPPRRRRSRAAVSTRRPAGLGARRAFRGDFARCPDSALKAGGNSRSIRFSVVRDEHRLVLRVGIEGGHALFATDPRLLHPSERRLDVNRRR